MVILCLLALILIAYMIWLAHHDTVTYEVVDSPNIPKAFHGYTIFFIADIHRRKIKKQTLKRIETNVDAVFIGGDFIEKGVSFDKLRANIRILQDFNMPIYFVWGNNDYETRPKEMYDLLVAENVIVLEDTVDIIHRGTEHINLIGFDFYFTKASSPLVDWQLIDQAYTILLTHKPSAFYSLHPQEKAKVDLVLAGHTHGGQIRLFDYGFYEKGGFKKEKEALVFVTEGYGYTLLPFRLGTKSQCHLITLQHTNNI